jgi:hypothetical protein
VVSQHFPRRKLSAEAGVGAAAAPAEEDQHVAGQGAGVQLHGGQGSQTAGKGGSGVHDKAGKKPGNHVVPGCKRKP